MNTFLKEEVQSLDEQIGEA